MVDTSPERPRVDPKIGIAINPAPKTEQIIDLSPGRTGPNHPHTEAIPDVIASKGQLRPDQLARREAIIHAVDTLFRQRRKRLPYQPVMRAKFRELFNLGPIEEH